MIDLTHYFNNKGLSNSNNYEQANLTGTGYSIPLIEENPLLSSFLKKDNIECDAQNIDLQNEVTFDNLTLIGLGAYCDVQNTIILLKQKKRVAKITTQFSSMYSSSSYFDDNVLFYQSDYLYNGFSQAQFIFPNLKGSLWKQEIHVPELITFDEIQLPFHPGLHIFAICPSEGGTTDDC